MCKCFVLKLISILRTKSEVVNHTCINKMYLVAPKCKLFISIFNLIFKFNILNEIVAPTAELVMQYCG